MAGGSLKYLLFAPVPEMPAAESAASAEDEFDESEIWGFWPEPRPETMYAEPRPETRHAEPRKASIPSSRANRRKGDRDRDRDRGTAARSLPVSIPDWSKILRGEHRRCASPCDEEDDEGIEGFGAVIPPHELLCRNRAESFSVQEGFGRTLKGRDLSRVRNAVWEKIGFQD